MIPTPAPLQLVKLAPEYKRHHFEMLDEWIHYKDVSHSPYAIFKNDYHDFDHYLLI